MSITNIYVYYELLMLLSSQSTEMTNTIQYHHEMSYSQEMKLLYNYIL